MEEYKKVLCISGSDSGAGAGMQADIKTVSACGGYATCVITVITAQNTIGVSTIYPIPASVIEKQIIAVLDDIGTQTIKIGMLHSVEIITIVAKILQAYRQTNIVLDPVMVATSGDVLLQKTAIAVLKKTLIPLSRIITPNIPEAEILLEKKIEEVKQLSTAAEQLGKKFHVSVLLKAGHLKKGDLIDVFYNFETGKLVELPSKRIHTRNTHGTGCSLSSAVATFLAKGETLTVSVEKAKNYLMRALEEGVGFQLGKGNGPIFHFPQKKM